MSLQRGFPGLFTGRQVLLKVAIGISSRSRPAPMPSSFSPSFSPSSLSSPVCARCSFKCTDVRIHGPLRKSLVALPLFRTFSDAASPPSLVPAWATGRCTTQGTVGNQIARARGLHRNEPRHATCCRLGQDHAHAISVLFTSNGNP